MQRIEGPGVTWELLNGEDRRELLRALMTREAVVLVEAQDMTLRAMELSGEEGRDKAVRILRREAAMRTETARRVRTLIDGVTAAETVALRSGETREDRNATRKAETL